MSVTLAELAASTIRTERDLAEHVRRFCRDLAAAGYDVLAYHTYDSRRSAAGFPDWIVLTPGGGFALELKTATGQPTPDQRRWLAAFGRRPGWTARIVRPADWPAVRDEIVAAVGVR